MNNINFKGYHSINPDKSGTILKPAEIAGAHSAARAAQPSLQRKNSTVKMSLLARLPSSESELLTNSRRGSLPSLNRRQQRRRSSTMSPSPMASQKGGDEDGAKMARGKDTPAAVQGAQRGPPVTRLASQARLALPETEVILEEEEEASPPGGAPGSMNAAAAMTPGGVSPGGGILARRSSLGRYSRHRYNSNVDEDGIPALLDSDNDDTISQTGSHASGKSRTLRPPALVAGVVAGNSRKMSRRRTEQSISPTPDGRSRRPTVDDAISHIIKFRRRGEAMSLFKRSVRKVMHVLTWMVVLSKKDSKIENQLKTFFDMAQELEDSSTMKHIEEQTGISFDPKYFRTSKQTFHLTFELRRCLTLISDCRTEDMVQRVVTGLQCLESFAEYPLHMQFKLAQVAWYQELPPKRMIIRQGHKAENFYFILSGTGIAKQLVREEHTGRVINRVIARLTKGQSFGEVALVQHQERASTVESVTHMQLLVVSREDFLDIFFATTDGGEPEHVNFCRQVDFLRHWPMERVQEEPQEVLFHYFRRGTVVVQDSRQNDWIYIVKSGTCMVLKKLKSVYPQRTWCAQKSQETALSFPRIGPRIDSRISTARKRHKGFNIPKALSQEMTAFFTKQFQGDSSETLMTSSSRADDPPASAREGQTDDTLNHNGTVNFPEGGNTLEVPESGDKYQTPRSDISGDGDRKRKLTMRSAPAPMRFSPRVIVKPKSIRGVLDAYMKSMETYIMRFKERTFDDHSSKGALWKDRPEEPCFVQLRKLRPRDAFGLEEVEFDDEKRYDVPDTSVTLVSNGAEMIMLSRKFFTKYANDHVKQFIREKIRPFPSEETLQENLQNKVNWDLYRQHTVNDVLTYRASDECDSSIEDLQLNNANILTTGTYRRTAEERR